MADRFSGHVMQSVGCVCLHLCSTITFHRNICGLVVHFDLMHIMFVYISQSSQPGHFSALQAYVIIHAMPSKSIPELKSVGR